jgi:fumarylacetoacetase
MTWTNARPGSGFGIEHLPYGSFSSRDGDRALGVRIGDQVLDVAAVARAGMLHEACDAPNLDRLLEADPGVWTTVRGSLVDLLTDPAHEAQLRPYLHDLEDVTLHLAFTVRDYVDFYSSEPHATNVGSMFRPDGDALLPNWKHLPVGYHGRAGTVCVDGTPVVRPTGQRKGQNGIVFGPSVKLDIELELAWVLGGRTAWGQPASIDQVEDHVFGVALFNDWSARDIQAWEYVPLGPFLGKSFASSLAAWITPMEALQAAKVPGPTQLDPVPLEYLQTVDHWALDIDLEVSMSTAAMREQDHDDHIICRSSTTNLYWTIAQQFAHLTVNGASVRPGDLCATGTISGEEPGSFGSLLELTWNGRDEIVLPTGEKRTFLEDGDEVVIRGVTADGAVRLGDVSGRIMGGR